MKTLRDTNNNNSTNQQYFPHRPNSDANHLPQTIHGQRTNVDPTLNADANQFSSLMQNYLTKANQNPIFPMESINPLLYLQLINANAMLMQQNDNHSMDNHVFVPKTRPMSQEEIAEHARLVYQRALQRNQVQQQQDFIKHFYETVNLKPNSYPVPTVPTATNLSIVSSFLFDSHFLCSCREKHPMTFSIR